MKKNQPPEKIILGIDPGTTVTGYALLSIQQSKAHLLQYGIINLKKVSNHAVKLRKIYDLTSELIQEYLPDEMAIEAQFYGKNVQSMLKLGRAQGVAIAAAISRDIPYTEYAPKKVKQSVTGNGNASKEQVSKMVSQLFRLAESPELFDATDAVSVALCHHYQAGALSVGKKTYGSWSSYLTDNPEKVK